MQEPAHIQAGVSAPESPCSLGCKLHDRQPLRLARCQRAAEKAGSALHLSEMMSFMPLRDPHHMRPAHVQASARQRR